MVRATTFGSGEGARSEVSFSYDDNGRLTQEIQNGAVIDYTYDTAGRLVGRRTPSGESVLEFDAAAELSRFTSNGQSLAFERNGLGIETSRSNPSGFHLSQQYDLCGRLSRQTGGGIERHYAWDRAGRLIGVTDNLRGRIGYHYDVRDQVRRVQRGGHLSERYDYNALLGCKNSVMLRGTIPATCGKGQRSPILHTDLEKYPCPCTYPHIFAPRKRWRPISKPVLRKPMIRTRQ